MLSKYFIVLLMTLALSGCQKSGSPEDRHEGVKKISVVTTLFPLYDFARAICGDKAHVTLLLPPGVEAHSYEPKPADMITINKADVFIYTNAAMEPWATRLLKGVASPDLGIVDASIGTAMLRTGGITTSAEQEHDHRHAVGVDPHIWLDFRNAAIMVDSITATVVRKDPVNATFYQERAKAYKAELLNLDAEFTSGLADCRKRVFLHGGHYAFGYLAAHYGLTYRSAQAVNPDSEPTPATIAGLVKQLKSEGLQYVYAEELVSPRVSEMLAREAGVKILKLHGAHNISKDDFGSGATFVSLMKKNLESLRTGLQCR